MSKGQYINSNVLKTIYEKIKGNAVTPALIESSVSDYLTANPPAGYTHPATHPATIITQDSTHRFTTDTEKDKWNTSVDISGKVDKVTGSRLVTSAEATDFHAAGSDNQELSGLQPKETGKGLSANDLTSALKTSYDGAVTHAGATHAPTTAQKNSDITKAEIEAKLTGELSSHTHAGGAGLVLGDLVTNAYYGDKGKIAYDHSQAGNPAFNVVYRTILDSTGSHIAGKGAGTYGVPQGNILAISGTGTLFALNTIYIAAADYPAIDGKNAKLRVRCVLACNDVKPFTGTFVIGLHPVTRPATSGGTGVCIYTIGAAVAGSTVTSTDPPADSLNNLAGADFALPADGFYVLGVVTNGTMATNSHCHISASLQIRNN